jgi:hypothetical protein
MAIKDKYANLLSSEVTTLGVTIQSTEIQTGVSLGEGQGIVIDEIDYFLGAGVLTDLEAGAAGDYMFVGLFTQVPTGANDFNPTNSRCIHVFKVIRSDFGVAANGLNVMMPIVFQFFPPMIVAAPRLYIACIASAAVSGGGVSLRSFFRYVKLSTQEYLELAESFVLVG